MRWRWHNRYWREWTPIQDIITLEKKKEKKEVENEIKIELLFLALSLLVVHIALVTIKSCIIFNFILCLTNLSSSIRGP